MKTESLEYRLALLWLQSSTGYSAIKQLAARKPLTHALEVAIVTVSKVPEIPSELVRRVEKRRAYLAVKGHNLPA